LILPVRRRCTFRQTQSVNEWSIPMPQWDRRFLDRGFFSVACFAVSARHVFCIFHWVAYPNVRKQIMSIELVQPTTWKRGSFLLGAACLTAISAVAWPALSQEPLVPGNVHSDSIPERTILGIDYRQTAVALVHVSGVVPNGPADRAGIRSNDRIMSIGMVRVMEIKDVAAALTQVQPNSLISIQIERGAQQLTLQISQVRGN